MLKATTTVIFGLTLVGRSCLTAHAFQPSFKTSNRARRIAWDSSWHLAATPEPIYLSDQHITTLRKESAKRLANKRMPVLFLTESETNGDFADSLEEICRALQTEELVQVRGISRDAKKQIRNVADALAIALGVEMGKDVNLVECKGHAAVFYSPTSDDDSPQKIKLFTSVGTKNEWKRKPKPVRDNRGQIIPGLYE